MSLQYPLVKTLSISPNRGVAELQVLVEAVNSQNKEMAVVVDVVLGNMGKFSQQISLAPKQVTQVIFAADKFPGLRVQNPQLVCSSRSFFDSSVVAVADGKCYTTSIDCNCPYCRKIKRRSYF